MSERVSLNDRGSDRLASRRRVRRRRTLIASGILLLVILGSIIYGLRQDAVRVSHVEIFGADDSFMQYATNSMQGNYFGIIPRDSIFFVPTSRIRAAVLAAHPDVAAISIFRSGLNKISIKITERAAIAEWCGLAPTAGVDEYCYIFDASGFIYADAATSTQTINNFKLYAPLEGTTLDSVMQHQLEPLKATLAYADSLPSAFDFARQLTTFGSSVSSIVINGDQEVSDYLTSGTRITYVLGHEQDAYTALVSAKENFNLADGSVDYVDLRFDGKVYLKKKTEQAQ